MLPRRKHAAPTPALASCRHSARQCWPGGGKKTGASRRHRQPPPPCAAQEARPAMAVLPPGWAEPAWRLSFLIFRTRSLSLVTAMAGNLAPPPAMPIPTRQIPAFYFVPNSSPKRCLLLSASRSACAASKGSNLISLRAGKPSGTGTEASAGTYPCSRTSSWPG